MWTYSSEQFSKQWRFLIDKDFVKQSGESFDYANNGLREWGDEIHSIPFPSTDTPYGSKCVAISDDGNHIAVSAGFEIYVFDLAEYKHEHTLQGHVSEINCLAFRPGCPTQLVSAAMHKYAEFKEAGPEIIFWDLSKQFPNIHGRSEAIEHLARNAANSIIAEIKSASSATQISSHDQKAFAKTLEHPIRELVVSRGAADNVKLFGRLLSNFQSETFSPSGKLLLYMPGKNPTSNGDADWELRLYSVDRQEDATILSGHRDNIVWAGFNDDETLVGTACWDRTFRVWDTKSGILKNLWTTENQNWTGGFSPDGRYFAGTSGGGKLHIYSLSDGTEHMVFDSGRNWCRALSWHPTSRLIALGGSGLGKLFVIDIEQKDTTQRRLLSTAAMKLPDDLKDKGVGENYLELHQVRFVDEGRKLAFYTTGDGSAEVYDLEQGTKWKFARAGTMKPPGDDSDVTTSGGDGMVVHEDHENKKIILACIDSDAVRLWSVPTTA